MSLKFNQLLSRRSREIESSEIRRIWELAKKCKDPIDLSIGQPDFEVDQSLKDAAIAAIQSGANGYSQTKGVLPLIQAVESHCEKQFDWNFSQAGRHSSLITSGTSGALMLAYMAILDAGDEIIIPDPYFLIYPTIATICGAKAIKCSTYPDFRMTANRIEELITERTKAVLINSPANPTGVVLSNSEVEQIADLCSEKNILLITDEIYDEFVFSDSTHVSPASFSDNVLLIRGFGKTYGCTGWRLGYAVGPTELIDEMAKMQQQTFVCAPMPLQYGVVPSFGLDNSLLVEDFGTRRDMVVDSLTQVTELEKPAGAFYAFPKVPSHLKLTATEFVQRCVANNLLVIQGSVFSSRDTHFRLSFAVANDTLAEGLEKLKDLMR